MNNNKVNQMILNTRDTWGGRFWRVVLKAMKRAHDLELQSEKVDKDNATRQRPSKRNDYYQRTRKGAIPTQRSNKP